MERTATSIPLRKQTDRLTAARYLDRHTCRQASKDVFRVMADRQAGGEAGRQKVRVERDDKDRPSPRTADVSKQTTRV